MPDFALAGLKIGNAVVRGSSKLLAGARANFSTGASNNIGHGGQEKIISSVYRCRSFLLLQVVTFCLFCLHLLQVCCIAFNLFAFILPIVVCFIIVNCFVLDCFNLFCQLLYALL